MTYADLLRLKQTLVDEQRSRLAKTIEELPAGPSIKRSTNKLAHDLRVRQLTKEEGMQDLLDVIDDVYFSDVNPNQ